MWDGEATAAACAWVIAREEEGLPDGVIASVEEGNEGYLQGKYRAKNMDVYMNRLGKTSRVSCTRAREDGSHEALEGTIQWGRSSV